MSSGIFPPVGNLTETLDWSRSHFGFFLRQGIDRGSDTRWKGGTICVLMYHDVDGDLGKQTVL